MDPVNTIRSARLQSADAVGAFAIHKITYCVPLQLRLPHPTALLSVPQLVPVLGDFLIIAGSSHMLAQQFPALQQILGCLFWGMRHRQGVVRLRIKLQWKIQPLFDSRWDSGCDTI
jgi:hypothetical protein